MDEADLPLMRQNIGGSDEPLSAVSHRIINNILQMVWRNMGNKVVDAENPAIYTYSTFRDYVREMRMLKKTCVGGKDCFQANVALFFLL